ncbi:hypothetical protein FQR65_LT17302 [Abscondita terminalis]|nr:hypothetical protein FQR65_LT17302 [Abscondita terminalis]
MVRLSNAGSKDRRKILETIRRNGDYMHNTYEEFNSGTVFVARRLKVDTTHPAKDITSCPECIGQFFKSSLRKHVKKYLPKTKDRPDIMVLSRGIHRQIHTKACQKLKGRVFPVLRDDACV